MLLYIGIVFAVVFGCFVILFFSLPIYDAWPTKKYDKYYEMSFSKEEWDQVRINSSGTSSPFGPNTHTVLSQVGII